MSGELELRELVRTAQFLLDWAVRLESGETTDARTAKILRKVVAIVSDFQGSLTRFSGGVLIHARAVADIYVAHRSAVADRSEHISAYFALLGPELDRVPTRGVRAV